MSPRNETKTDNLTTTIEPVDGDTGGTVWDAPNQQVVRADNSAPWEEGTGGEAGEATPEVEEEPAPAPATTEPASE